MVTIYNPTYVDNVDKFLSLVLHCRITRTFYISCLWRFYSFCTATRRHYTWIWIEDVSEKFLNEIAFKLSKHLEENTISVKKY